MPRQCEICGKGYSKTIKRSHSMRASIRRLLPNLQWARINGKRVKACTRCIKTAGKKEVQLQTA
jgi:ribosomal protein L28